MRTLAALALLGFSVPAIAAMPKGGIGPVRTINSYTARQAVRAAIAKKFDLTKGYRIYFKDAGPAADSFKALGPKGQMGLRFSAAGLVVQGAGQAKAKVTKLSRNDL